MAYRCISEHFRTELTALRIPASFPPLMTAANHILRDANYSIRTGFVMPWSVAKLRTRMQGRKV